MQPAYPCSFFSSGIAETPIAAGLFRTPGYPLQKTIEKTLLLPIIAFTFLLVLFLDIFFHNFSHDVVIIPNRGAFPFSRHCIIQFHGAYSGPTGSGLCYWRYRPQPVQRPKPPIMLITQAWDQENGNAPAQQLHPLTLWHFITNK